MKKTILLILLVGSAAYGKEAKPAAPPPPAAAAVTQVAPQPQEIKVGVKGMVCAFCAQGIEKNLLNEPEVSKVEVSLENKYVKIKYKEGKSLPKEKITEILKDAGYEAVYGE